MSYRKDDWDLCWYDLSSTGCRNSNCKWRHVRAADSLYSSHYQNKSGKGGCRAGDPRNPGAPFYSVMQHQDGGIEDQYGLVHYPDVDDECSDNLRMQLMRNQGNHCGSEHSRSDSSSMSISSFKTPTSTTTSIKSLQVWSDSEGDIINNIMAGSTNAGKVRKVFLKSMLGEFQTSGKSQKMELQTENETTSLLSPLAKVFVPHKLMMKTRGSRIDDLRGSANESYPTAGRWLPGAVE